MQWTSLLAIWAGLAATCWTLSLFFPSCASLRVEFAFARLNYLLDLGGNAAVFKMEPLLLRKEGQTYQNPQSPEHKILLL